MKTKNLFITLIMATFLLINIIGIAGNKETHNLAYRISLDKNFTQNSTFLKSWEIFYGESKTNVHVFMKETKKGQEYFVSSKYFEVKYVNNTNGFGVRMLNNTESTVNESLNNAVLNFSQLNAQKCISAGAIESSQILEMIASFLPDLINEQYKNILE